MRTGANLYVWNPKFPGPLIAWFTRGRGEGPVRATHQAKFYNETHIVHANWPEVTVEPWAEYCKKIEARGCAWAITERLDDPTPCEQATLRELALKMKGWKYNLLAFGLYAIDGLLAKVFGTNLKGLDVLVFRRFSIWKRGMVCSKTASWIDIKLGWRPEQYIYAAPDDNWDYDLAHPGTWTLANYSPGWFRPRSFKIRRVRR